MANSPNSQYRLRFLKSITEITQVDWNTLVDPGYPFLKHEFLLALEESQCTTAASGWQPYHVLVETGQDAQQEVVAIMPMYLKTNSTGEYVFDWSWADAYQQHGLEYYPKFVSAIPFTPSAGPRICIGPGQDHQAITALLCQLLPAQAQKLGVSSWHILFPQQELSEQLQLQGIQLRLGCQYQWFNHDFVDFDDFLKKFSSRKRKNINKERSKVKASGIEFEIIEGIDINQEQWQAFYQFYQSTYFVRGRQPYLSEDFFLRVGASMPESLLLVMAKKEGAYIAGALSFQGSDTLYGRYWGCTEEYQFLHFETCYYQGIEYCIKKNLQRFDSGAQGEHKIQRGFEPVLTYSNHWIAHPQFDEAIGRFLLDEKPHIEAYVSSACDALPFKKQP